MNYTKRKQYKPIDKPGKHTGSMTGGAIYTFDLNDKIGGLPARIPLNGTQDGDCPATDTANLGFVNYGMTKGGARRYNQTKKKHNKKRNSHTKRRNGKSRKHRK